MVSGGHLEIRCRMNLSRRSMAAEVKRCPGPPAYELQLMLAVFDFPTWSDGADDELVPEFFIDRISSD